MLVESAGAGEREGSKPLRLEDSGDIPVVACLTTPVVTILGFSVGSIVPNFLTPVTRSRGERKSQYRRKARYVGVRFYTNPQGLRMAA